MTEIDLEASRSRAEGPTVPSTARSQPVLSAIDLGVRIGPRWLFRGLDLDLAPGRIGAVLGPNGVGKTTLLRALLGRRAPDQGHVAGRRPIGYVPQRSETAFAYRVLDMVVMGRARHIGSLSSPGSRDRRIARSALERVGAGALSERTFDTLSGGERQLVLIARALAAEPGVLLLDEPASALDLSNQVRLLAHLRALARDDGLAILFTSHHPQHAGAIADDVALIAGDGSAAWGIAGDLLADDRLQALYGVPVRALNLVVEGRSVRTLVPIVEPGR